MSKIGQDSGHAGQRIKFGDAPTGTITRSRLSEPDGHGGFLLDLDVKWDDGRSSSYFNEHTRNIEECIDRAKPLHDEVASIIRRYSRP